VTGWAIDTASDKGRSLDLNSVVIFTLRDGKVTEARHFVDDQAALDAFLA
jgi:ketosteroid isomerase-like protein